MTITKDDKNEFYNPDDWKKTSLQLINENTHDKEWKVIEDKNKGIVYSEGNDKIGYNFCYVDKTLLDQIRRNAKKELFDDIEPIIEEIRNLVPHIETSKHWKDYEQLRAKTLGDNK